jgi:hypothetical protein
VGLGPGARDPAQVEAVGHGPEQLDGEERQSRGVGADASDDTVELERVVARQQAFGEGAETGGGERPDEDGRAGQVATDAAAQIVEVGPGWKRRQREYDAQG